MNPSAHRNERNSAARIALLAALAACALSAEASEVYKCVDAAGKVTYADAPCGGEAAKAPILLSPEEAAKAERKARIDALSKGAEKRIADIDASRSADDAKRDAQKKAWLAQLRTEADADPWGIAEKRCAEEIAEKMRYLEPVGQYAHAGNGTGLWKDDYKVRVTVRLADSFRAAPVGVIECEVNVYTRRTTLEKVRM